MHIWLLFKYIYELTDLSLQGFAVDVISKFKKS